MEVEIIVGRLVVTRKGCPKIPPLAPGHRLSSRNAGPSIFHTLSQLSDRQQTDIALSVRRAVNKIRVDSDG